MRVQELETDEGILEISAKKLSEKTDFFHIKLNTHYRLAIAYDVLFILYLAIICSVIINTL